MLKPDLSTIARVSGDVGHANSLAAHPVSYTHLDVYKRQKLHGVDTHRQRWDRAWALRPEEFQRNRERVVDEHFLTRRDVEITFDQIIDEVPREIDVAARRRQRRDTPALVRVVIFARRAH